MKKNVRWLKEEIEEDIKSWGGGNPDYFRGASDAYENVKDWLNQLDEPEVNSQIDKLANFIMGEVEGEPSQNQGAVDTAIRIIKFYQYQESLSQELPVIPKFVADWIKEHRDRYGRSLLAIGYDFHKSDLNNSDVDDWVYRNTKAFIRAWVVGFTIEEEQKYYVLSKDRKTILLERWADGFSPCAMPITEVEEGDMFTEQEIKDYDERYLAFKVPVEELEDRKPIPTINASDPFGASQIGDLIDH